MSLHLLNPPDVMILPCLASPIFPLPPRIRSPEADLRLLEVTTRRDWEPRRIVVTYEEVRSDPFLWTTMFFRDWDRIPEPLRDQGLARMMARFWDVLDRPDAWLRMTPDDWDRVPQPIRAMAFINMVARWETCYAVAERTGLARAELVPRLQAVAMAESWFQHRAANQNADGTSDLGLAQATTATRNLLRWRAAAGLTDFRFEDDEYFDPLKSSRVLVYWFALMLDETDRDLDGATRAYNVGSGRAREGQGADYLAGVRALEQRYIRDGLSPSWRFLRARNPGPPIGQPERDADTPCRPDESPRLQAPASNVAPAH